MFLNIKTYFHTLAALASLIWLFEIPTVVAETVPHEMVMIPADIT